MSGTGGNDDGDEPTNIDGSLIDPLAEDTSVGEPPVASRTTTDADPTGVHAVPPVAPAKPPLAVVPDPAGRPLIPVPAPPRERTRTPAPIPPPPPDAARERTRTPPAGVAPPPPPADALRERTRTPAAGRPITPPAPPDAARERARTPAAGQPITSAAPPPPAIARTTTPVPSEPPAVARTKSAPVRVPGVADAPEPPAPAIARTTTPVPSEPPAVARTKSAPVRLPGVADAPEPPAPAIARTKAPGPADAARERAASPAPTAIASATKDQPAPPAASSRPAVAATKTPDAGAARERADAPAPTDAAARERATERTKTPAPGRPISPPADISRERAASPAPTDSARERTKTPAPGRPITPPADTEAPPARASSPALTDSARERARPRAATDDDFANPAPMIGRAKTPAPVDAARERTKTPAPGRPITPSAADAMSQPKPARAASPAPTDEARERAKSPALDDSQPPKRRAATAPPEREVTPIPTTPRRAATAPPAREVTPVPTAPKRRASTAPPERELTPVPVAPRRSQRASTDPPTGQAAPQRSQRASTNPPTDSLRARSPSNPPSGRAADARSVPTASIPDREPWLHRIARIAPWVIIALPALFQVFLLSTAITGRLMYPYDLEWMEGGMLHHAQRIHGGLGIYVAPSIEFIPYLYTPLYPSLLALFGGAFGFSYTLGRAFSVLALIGIAVVAAVSIANPRHEHVRRAPAYAGVTIALGLFAAAYPFMEGWYDLVRADTFFLFMVTAAIAGLPRWAATGTGIRGHGRVAAGAVLLALAFFCKQTGIIYVAFGGLIVLVVAWRRVPAYVLMAGLIGLGGTWLLQRTTDGWFWVYIQKIHQAHDFNWDRFWKSFENILWHFPAMTIVIAAGLVIVLVTAIWRRKLPRSTHPLLLWSSTFAVSTLLGAIGWGTEFAHFNAYMPAFLHGALAAGAAIPAIYGCARLLHGRRSGAEAVSTLLALGAAIPLAFACYQHRWDPKKFMPTQRDVDAGDRLIARIRGIEGDVWMPSHPWYLVLAGKAPRVHRMGVKDVTWRQTRSVDGLDAALQHHAFAALVLDGTDIHNAEPATSGLVNANYRAALKLPADERPRVYTGARVSPDSIWLPAIPAQPPRGTRALFDFEQAAWDGWTLSGAAWGARPENELAGHGLLVGATGRKYATSMHGGDVATGRVTSPAFTLDGTLSIKLGGGTDATKLRVEVWVAGAIVATAAVPAAGGETLHTVTIDPGVNRGASATLVFVDDSPAGHLDVDDVWLTP